MPTLPVRLSWLCSLLALSLACGPDSIAQLTGEGEDEELELSLSELNATFVVQLVNSGDATVELLNQQVGLDVRAAKGIVAARPFTTLAQIDAVPYVGSVALAKLDAFATARFGSSGVTVDGVVFTATEAASAVSVVNDARLLEVGLSSTAYTNLNVRRPFATIVAIAAVSGVGPVALTDLRSYVRSHAGTPTPTLACTGGTYDGVAFTQAEACHAVDFLNHARFSEMGALTDRARLVAYELNPNGVLAPTRSAAWTSLTQFAAISLIGTTALASLKAGAAAWTANGLSYDTVATTWINRAALLGQPVYLDKVYVTKLLPQTSDDGGFNWECAELRDSPTSSNYFLGCKPAVVCGGSCWDPALLNTFVTRVYGTVKRSSIAGSGGYRISMAH